MLVVFQSISLFFGHRYLDRCCRVESIHPYTLVSGSFLNALYLSDIQAFHQIAHINGQNDKALSAVRTEFEIANGFSAVHIGVSGPDRHINFLVTDFYPDDISDIISEFLHGLRADRKDNTSVLIDTCDACLKRKCVPFFGIAGRFLLRSCRCSNCSLRFRGRLSFCCSCRINCCLHSSSFSLCRGFRLCLSGRI